MKILDRFKKMDSLVIRSFIGPYLLSFFIAQFVLVMQFLWKYIDDILGKGFSVLDLLELITYFAITNIPMALPIAILLSSVMVFGNMSEKHELSSLKSAGVSLLRIMRPAIVLAIATALLSILASNVLKPQANFQFQKRLRAMKSQKPSLTIEAKIFNRDFNGYAIRVNEKNDEDETIKDVYIYDHTTTDKSLMNLTKAEKGKMYNDENGGLFIMELENGTSYRENKRERKKGENGKKYPFMRTEFKEWKKVFDMSEFDTDDDGISINRKKEDMLNTFQLLNAIDSVDQRKMELVDSVVNDDPNEETDEEKKKREDIRKKESKVNPLPEKKKQEDQKKVKKPTRSKYSKNTKILTDVMNKNTPIPKKNLLKRVLVQNQTDTLSNYDYWYKTISDTDRNNVPVKAVQSSGRRKDLLRNATSNIKTLKKKREKYILVLNQQYSFALICIVFLFIGAPLGSIIRKGGYGYPLLFAILFYMLFIISTIMGTKLEKSDTMDPITAAWIANILVFPVAIWLTTKALKDSKFEGWKVFSWIGNKINSLKKSTEV